MKRPYIPRGCDQQGRRPDRVHPEDDAETPHVRVAALIACAFIADVLREFLRPVAPWARLIFGAIAALLALLLLGATASLLIAA